jgi:hypothetical protein
MDSRDFFLAAASSATTLTGPVSDVILDLLRKHHEQFETVNRALRGMVGR